MATAYSNVGGSDNRFDKVYVTTNFECADTARDPHLLVNGANDTYYWNASQSGGYILFDFGPPRVIDEAKWLQDMGASHGTWKWQGSDDASTFVDIGGSFTLGGGTTTTHTSLNGNTTAYRYYRLLQVSGVSSYDPYLYEIQFQIDPPDTALGYWSPLTVGNKTATLSITGSSGLFVGSPTELIDGDPDDIAYFNTSTSAGNIDFDFGSPIALDSISLYQSNTFAHGVWQMKGSTDGSSFDDIGSPFTLGSSTRLKTQHDFAPGNLTEYRYWRMEFVSGVRYNTPYLRQFNFGKTVGGVTPPGSGGTATRRRPIIIS